jgi:3-phenylpropionate/trans-cinnamate dioxygenase ferredoxin component
MADFIEVARVHDVPPGTATVARIGDIEVAVVNVDGTFYAIDNECTHRGGSLGDGEINTDWSDGAIQCPLHGSVFDVRTGEVLNPPAVTPVQTYSVEVADDGVRVSTD